MDLGKSFAILPQALGRSLAARDSAGLPAELEGDGVPASLVVRCGSDGNGRKGARGGKSEYPGEEAFSRWIVAHGATVSGWKCLRKKGSGFGL